MALSLPKSSICLRRRRRRLACSSSRAASEFPSRSVWQASHPVWVTPLSPAARLWGFSPLCLKSHSSQLCLHPDTLHISTFLLRPRHFLPIPPHPLCSPSQSPHPAAPSFPPRFFLFFPRFLFFFFSSIQMCCIPCARGGTQANIPPPLTLALQPSLAHAQPQSVATITALMWWLFRISVPCCCLTCDHSGEKNAVHKR